MDSSQRPSAIRLACRAFPPERFLIPAVHLFDPQHGLDAVGDLLVEKGKIAALGAGVKAPAGVEVLDDLRGCWVFPGFVDPHCHLRTPGYEYKEDLASGTAAAAAGGYVVVTAMANTDPTVDSGPLAEWVLDEAEKRAIVRVGQVGAVSKGLRGDELAEMRELVDAGVVAFSDDGMPLGDADLLLHAMRYLRGTGRALLLHSEERDLSMDGVMHAGKWSARLGLRGIPAAAEAGPIARDLEIVRYAHEEHMRILASRKDGGANDTGTADEGEVPLVHFQHLSAEESVRLLRRAKDEQLPVSAEVTPAHLLLTDERLTTLDANLKINPPLRSEADRQALVEALADGTIDCVGTDHAPHAAQEKEVPIEDALFGSTGLETAFAALHGGLVRKGALSLERLVEAMSGGPCRVLGLSEPRLEVGASAELCVVDLEQEWMVTPADLKGKSRNCALIGERLTGRVLLTVVEGARRYVRAR